MPKSFVIVLKVLGLSLLVSLALFADHFEIYFLNGVAPVPIRFLNPSLQGVILLGVAAYFAFILYLRGSSKHLLDPTNPTSWLVCFLLISTIRYAINRPSTVDAMILLISACIGQVVAFIALDDRGVDTKRKNNAIVAVLLLLAALALGATWPHHFGTTYEYRGRPRWSGAWDNPNISGLLMGTGTVLAGTIAAFSARPSVISRKLGSGESRIREWVVGSLCLIMMLLMARGLLRSYSRGAWLATLCGFGFLLWRIAKYPIPGLAEGIPGPAVPKLSLSRFSPYKTNAGTWSVLALSVCVLTFWQFRRTDWIPAGRLFSVANLKDLSWRNRIDAWQGALQITGEHPWFGSGWNRPGQLYENYYLASRLTDSRAIEVNDYLMLGAALGIPALFCFCMYSWLALRDAKSVRLTTSGLQLESKWLQITCQAAAIILLVGFWYDGGLFKLPTASTFWILLELGRQPSSFQTRSEFV